MLCAVGLLAVALFGAFNFGCAWQRNERGGEPEMIFILIALALISLFAGYLSGVL